MGITRSHYRAYAGHEWDGRELVPGRRPSQGNSLDGEALKSPQSGRAWPSAAMNSGQVVAALSFRHTGRCY